jgi:hypothetical protein
VIEIPKCEPSHGSLPYAAASFAAVMTNTSRTPARISVDSGYVSAPAKSLLLDPLAAQVKLGPGQRHHVEGVMPISA